MKFENKVAKILFGIGIAEMVGGIILGYYFGMEDVGYYSSRHELNGGIFLIFTLSGLIGGMLLIGFAELIERQSETNALLKTMVYGTKDEIASTTSLSSVKRQSGEISNKENVEWDIEDSDYLKIKEYFSKKNRYVDQIIATPFNHKYVIISGSEEHLINMDRGYSNLVNPVKFETYPEVKKWLDEYLDGK